MRKAAVKIIVNAVALWVASVLVSGIHITGDGTRQKVVTVLIVAVIFAVVNTFIKPVVKLLSLPLLILSLGLLSFIINALMLLLTSKISDTFAVRFHVDGFGTALIGSLVVTFVSMLMHIVIKEEKH